MKKRFWGIYYKYQSLDGFTIATIDSYSNEGHMIQIITDEKSYLVKDDSSVKTSMEGIEFNVHQEDLDLVGQIKNLNHLKPKKNIMSYYRFLPIECKHQIYSMHQDLEGKITINGKDVDFDKGHGYIEGDKGRNFPTEYLWFNASNNEAAVTLAIATIPLGLFTIKGSTCMVEHNGKEYRFGTYNFAKPVKISREEIVLKKGKYLLAIIPENDNPAHALKAPVKGDMVRYIHECPAMKARIILTKKGETIFDVVHPHASLEYVFK